MAKVLRIEILSDKSSLRKGVIYIEVYVSRISGYFCMVSLDEDYNITSLQNPNKSYLRILKSLQPEIQEFIDKHKLRLMMRGER